MMTSRLLPPEEWGRLHQTEIPAMIPYVNPQTMQVIVIEQDGQIIGAWAVLIMTHLEGVWIDPAYRKNPRVASKLLAATMEHAAANTSWAMTGAMDDYTERLLTKHLGAVPVSAQMFMVPVKGIH